MTEFKKSILNIEDAEEVLQKITARIAEIENLQQYVEEKIRNASKFHC